MDSKPESIVLDRKHINKLAAAVGVLQGVDESFEDYCARILAEFRKLDDGVHYWISVHRADRD